ncbi:MAG: hypothetical protein WC076_04765 [Terrimicrobiaceae bacterium]|jgi:hypothetical protein|nr:hypothetical protein [Terrimicrobiaceae bacterium]
MPTITGFILRGFPCAASKLNLKTASAKHDALLVVPPRRQTLDWHLFTKRYRAGFPCSLQETPFSGVRLFKTEDKALADISRSSRISYFFGLPRGVSG